MDPHARATPIRVEQRLACRLSCHVRPDATLGDALRLSRNAGDGDGGARGSVVDLSRGGGGVICGVFFPRGARLEVRITSPDGGTALVKMRVQRVEMRDRTPTYYLGLSLLQQEAGDSPLEPLLEHLRRAATEVRT